MQPDPEAESLKKGGFSDLMKKAFSAGIGAVFLTEESLRAYLQESKLPRDVARSILQSATGAKEQVFQYVSAEVSQLIRKVDVAKLAESFLETHTIEVEAKIRFRPQLRTPTPEAAPGPAAATASPEPPSVSAATT